MTDSQNPEGTDGRSDQEPMQLLWRVLMRRFSVGRVFIVLVVLGLMPLSVSTYGQKKADPWAAAITGDLNMLQRELEAGVSPDVREPNGSTPLILAAMFGQTDLVPFLIERKAQVNIQNNDGSTALIVAAVFGHPDIVTLLLEAGAETDLRNNDGMTALEAVSDPWSEELRGIYEFFDAIFQMQLDIDRIREIRPEVHAILQTAG